VRYSGHFFRVFLLLCAVLICFFLCSTASCRRDLLPGQNRLDFDHFHSVVNAPAVWLPCGILHS